jgi:hypothetical protein
MRLWLHGVQSAVNAQDSLSQQRLLLAMPLAMPDSTFPPRALSEGGGWRWKGGRVERWNGVLPPRALGTAACRAVGTRVSHTHTYTKGSKGAL